MKPRLMRPIKELKGFAKTELQPGEIKTVTVPLDPNAFAYCDPDHQSWVCQADDFKIFVGSSSRDIRLTGDFTSNETTSQSWSH